MAGVAVEAGSALAQQIQNAAQAKLMENSWAPEETDTTLSEYVTMMLVNGKDMQGVQSELGSELLGLGEDDPQVAEFTRWLFDQARQLSGQGAPAAERDQSMEAEAAENGGMDEQMGEAAPVDGAYVEPAHSLDFQLTSFRPSGPRAMRNGSDRGRGRGGRMLGQMNRQMDRNSDDPLRRIKGAAGGAGRIDAHAGRAPRGPRGGNLANGVQRMMNGGGRGGHMAQMNNPMMGQLPQDQQMMFMQMMEMQANMMAQMMGNSQTPPSSGGYRGGRGGKSMFDRMDKRGQHKARSGTPGDESGSTGGMEIDRPLEPERGAPFDTMCKFNLKCLNPDCPFAHQSPANTRAHINLDMTDTCSYGAACTNNKCLARHPSPAKRSAFVASAKSEVVCKFFPNCSAGNQCPFKHPSTPACRNGADCKVEGCPFSHSQIACRYNPCTRRDCLYKHAEGQKRGAFSDKVWTAEDGSAGIMEQEGANTTEGKANRFAELAQNGEANEELIIPGQANGAGEAHGSAEKVQETVS